METFEPFGYTTSGSDWVRAPYWWGINDVSVEMRAQLCAQAASRQELAAADLNWFGLERDYLMYLHPDTVEGFREDAYFEFESAKNLFDALKAQARDETTQVSLLADNALSYLETERERVDIRATEQAARVRRTLELLNAMVAELDVLSTAFSDQVAVIQRNLEASPCDVFCVLGDIISMIGSLAGAISNVVSAFSALEDLFSAFDTGLFNSANFHILNGRLDIPPADADYRGLSNYAMFVYTSFNVKRQDGSDFFDDVGKLGKGLKSVVENGKKALDEAKKVKLPSEPRDVASAWTKFANTTQEAKAEIRGTMRQVQDSIARVETLPAGRVKDREAALGDLRYLIGLLEERLQRMYRIDELQLEHLNASGELTALGREQRLMSARADTLRVRINENKCRMGTLTGSICEGVVATQGIPTLDQIRGVCLASEPLVDRLLLFDFYYDRSKAFMTLDEREANDPRANDFSRKLLDSTQVGNFDRVPNRRWQDALLVDPTPGALTIGLCSRGQACTHGAAADSSYRDDVVSRLRNYGTTSFDLDDDCDAAQARVAETGNPEDAPLGACAPSVYTGGLGEPRRVTDFDVRLLMEPGYYLGCQGDQSDDGPVDAGIQFTAFYRHEEAAKFFVPSAAGLQTKYVGFPEGNTRQACDIANAFELGAPRDCGQVINFSGQKAESSPTVWDTQTLRLTSPIFGTSVRGSWHIDIGPTLSQLNSSGVSSDQCFDDKIGSGVFRQVPDRCLPDNCLSPCFDDQGQRDTSADAPQFCQCYDDSNQLRTTVPPALTDVCINLPSELAWNIGRANGLEECSGNETGYGETGTETLYQSSCDRFVDPSGFLYPNGDGLCCSSDGRFKLNLSDREYCASRGYVNNAACRAPDICREICGPRCKAFKRAMRGFESRISWVVRASP